MRNIKFLLSFGLAMLVGLHLLGMPISIFAQVTDIQFKRVEAGIYYTKEKKGIDRRVYESNDLQRVESEWEIFGSDPFSSEGLKMVKAKWELCGKEEDVINPKGETVGKRTLYSSGKERRYAVFYTYRNTLRGIAGTSLRHVEALEAQSCPRSKTVSGKVCKY